MTRTIKIITVISIITITELLAIKLNALEHEERATRIVHKLNKEIKATFDDALITSEVLKEMVLLSTDRTFSQQQFDQLSKKLLSTYTNVDALLYLPKGIVKYASPYVEHKLAIGHNVLLDIRRKRGADESIHHKKTTIIGPVTLVQNERQAFILRKGITDDSEFIGFSSSIVYLDTILDIVEKSLDESDINQYSIVGYNPDSDTQEDKVIANKGNATKYSHHGVINLYNTKWDIYIFTNNGNFASRLVIFAALSLLAMLVWAAITYFRRFQAAERQRHDLQHEAHCDFLTGLLNRRGFEYRFNLLKEKNTSGSIAIFDIDFFKNINDSYGHDIGDAVLVQFTKLCAAHTTSEFILSRTGGEEFMLLMPDLNQYQAKEICEKLRIAVEKAPFFIKHLNINITVSIGISNFASNDKMETALSYADDALYQAKKNGRNQVCIYA
ncbi:sensor domain-containing diguanylate cyclase [Vibrio panuliri]|uniref:diguanylate cyclase n=1 Tax=Vibrio panuliri TaxID=1381081 RepID=A0ABX3FQ35_9VIBR|nr:sensor domain-containing diguanylate cyclase [Vibrio panuliri]KAB1458079.1 sensor domain-containing diguanylate cyclase [Vibrio panuliri]OLQ95122.1 histidine kinase [Vibrio panuliri]